MCRHGNIFGTTQSNCDLFVAVSSLFYDHLDTLWAIFTHYIRFYFAFSHPVVSKRVNIMRKYPLVTSEIRQRGTEYIFLSQKVLIPKFAFGWLLYASKYYFEKLGMIYLWSGNYILQNAQNTQNVQNNNCPLLRCVENSRNE